MSKCVLNGNHFAAILKPIWANFESENQAKGREIAKTLWPHLSEMMFLESSEVTQSFPSTSTLELEGAYDDCSILNELTQLSNAEPSLETVQPTPVPKKRQKREKASEVLGNIACRQDDRYGVFRELVASHLRRLPEDAAFNLEGRIMELIYSQPAPSRTNVTNPNTMTTSLINPPQIDSVPNQQRAVYRPIARRLGLHPSLPRNEIQIRGSHDILEDGDYDYGQEIINPVDMSQSDIQ